MPMMETPLVEKVHYLLQREFLVLTSGQTTVDGNGAAISHRTAGRRRVEDLRDGQGALAQKVIGFQAAMQLFQLTQDITHLENGVVAALGGRTMGTDAFDLHLDLHAAALAPVDAAVGGLGGDHELRLQA